MKDKKWQYHDERNNASPFPLYYNIISAVGKNSNVHGALGTYLKGMMIFFQGDKWKYYTIEGDMNNMGKELSEKIKNDPKFLEHAIKETYRHGERLLALTNKIKNSDLRKKNNEELLELYEEYKKRINEMRGYAWIGPGLDHEGVFTRILEEILKKKLEGREIEIAKYFSTLTNPKKHTTAKIQEINLLKIAVNIKNNQELKRLFEEENNNLKLIEKLEEFPIIHNSLKKHREDYCWVPCTYEGEPWNIDYFLDIIQKLIKNEKPEDILREIEDTSSNNELKREKAIKELSLNEEEKHLFHVASEVLFFKADRKDIFFQSYYEINFLLREIGNRLGLNLKETKYLTPKEIKKYLLEEKKFSKEEAQRRINSSLIMKFLEEDLEMLVGKEAEDYVQNFAIEEEFEITNELKGSSANSGYAKGKAKLILSPKDMHKMQEGDILIANSTNPDVIPAIKKAAAIVTNTGGITCHAAIVSREFKIPCIVGTKHATKIFKDNDLVEVDADKGVVRKIQ